MQTMAAESPVILDPFTRYIAARERMLPGDLIAFAGRGPVSDVIRLVTSCPVSHVGMVLHRRDGPAGAVVEVIESTSLDGFAGVTASRMSARLLGYDGSLWWLPLHPRVRERMNEAALVAFLHAQEGKPYDAVQAALAGIHRLGLPGSREDWSRWFCSEICARALVESGAVRSLNASQVTPAGLIEWSIYSDCYQLSGVAETLPRFNSMAPSARSVEGFV